MLLNLNLKSILKVLVIILVVAVALYVGSLMIQPSHATTATGPIQCHYQIGSQPPCHNRPVKIIPLYQHSVPLTFGPDHWSQQVWVPANFGLAYICDGASRNDTLVIMDEYNTHSGSAWDMAIPHLHIVCDAQWHGIGVNWRYAHMTVVGTTRAVTVIVRR